jgi:hypothetical protein
VSNIKRYEMPPIVDDNDRDKVPLFLTSKSIRSSSSIYLSSSYPIHPPANHSHRTVLSFMSVEYEYVNLC